MYADRDDAPTPHRSGLPLLAMTILGGAAVAAALYLPGPLAAFAPPAQLATQAPPTFTPQARTAPSTPPPTTPQPLARPAKPTTASAAPQIHAYRPSAPSAESTPRQTAFNEHNYRPREIVNRLPAQRSVKVERQAKRQAKRPKTLTRSAKWSWETHKGTVRGTFQWHEQNGRIDYASVCRNEKAGSLRYRDCRKGAKATFARLCRERRDPAACHAENNYSPLR